MEQDNGFNGDNSRKAPTPERPGVPRWVKVFGLVAVAIAVILVVLMLLGVEHGPGLHSLVEFPTNPAQTTPGPSTPIPTLPVSTAGTAL